MANECLLYPAYQKFYSSLKSLDNFIKSKDFVDFVSSIDNFFGEFRNITFVIKSQLADTDYIDLYSNLINKYLVSEKMKWFNDKRVEETHIHPTILEKQVCVNVFNLGKNMEIINQKYKFSNWDNVNNLFSEITEKLQTFKSIPELYLSIKFIFKENGNEIDILDRVFYGIDKMFDFLIELDEKINCNCDKCLNLKELIKKMINDIKVGSISFTRDYEYLPSKNKFRLSGYATLYFGTKSGNIYPSNELRVPLKDNILFKHIDSVGNLFKDIILFHIFIFLKQKKHIMPTFIIIYNDDTMAFKSFLANSKSTFYRMTNEISQKIDTDDIRTIYFIWELYEYGLANIQDLNVSYEKRIKLATTTYLAFYCINKDLSEMYRLFDEKKIKDSEYIKKKISKPVDNMTFYQFRQLKIGFAKKYHKYLNLDKVK